MSVTALGRYCADTSGREVRGMQVGYNKGTFAPIPGQEAFPDINKNDSSIVYSDATHMQGDGGMQSIFVGNLQKQLMRRPTSMGNLGV